MDIVEMKGKIILKFAFCKTKNGDFVISFIILNNKKQKFELCFYGDLAQKANEELFINDYLKFSGNLKYKDFVKGDKINHKIFISVKQYEKE